MCGNKLKLKKQYLGDCKGKPITFKELKELSPSTTAATARVNSPASDSDSEDITQAMTRMNTQSESEEFGFSENTLSAKIASFTINRVINKETFPKWSVLKKTEFVKDKSCIICFKSDMNQVDLSKHIERKHLLSFDEDDIIADELEDWIYVAKKMG